jgi:conjugative transfer signal peptidase TraF
LKNNKHRLATIVSVSLTCLFCAGLYVVNIVGGYYVLFNDSDSFPNRVYLAREKTPTHIKQGSLVVFQKELPNTPYEKRLKNLDIFKEVVCLEGDYLERARDRFVCNGVTIAEVRNADSKGEPYAVSFDYNDTIPEGRYFVTAPHYHSFDSRYFGLIDKEAIKGEIICAIF